MHLIHSLSALSDVKFEELQNLSRLRARDFRQNKNLEVNEADIQTTASNVDLQASHVDPVPKRYKESEFNKFQNFKNNGGQQTGENAGNSQGNES